MTFTPDDARNFTPAVGTTTVLVDRAPQTIALAPTADHEGSHEVTATPCARRPARLQTHDDRQGHTPDLRPMAWLTDL